MRVGLGVVMGVLTMTAGCAAPSENQEPAEESDTVSQEVNTAAGCAYATNKNESQKRATRALRVILGANNVGEQNCDSATKNKLYTIRNAIRSGELTITSTVHEPSICGVPAKRITMVQSGYTTIQTPSSPLWDAIHALAVNGGPADVCFGNGTSTFLVLQTNATKIGPNQYRNWVQFDPSTAILNGTLTNNTGAAAAWSDGSAATAFKLGYFPGSCGNATGGQPCSTSTQYAGQELLKSVVQNGSSCSCR